MLEHLLTYSDIHADIYPAQLGMYLVTNLCRGQNLMLLNKFENNTKPCGKPHHWNLRRGGGAALAPGFRFGARRWWAQPDSFGGGAERHVGPDRGPSFSADARPDAFERHRARPRAVGEAGGGWCGSANFQGCRRSGDGACSVGAGSL